MDQQAIEKLLTLLSRDYFAARKLTPAAKKRVLSQIAEDIKKEKETLMELIIDEIKLTEKDAEREIERAYKTFSLAARHTSRSVVRTIKRSGKVIEEDRIPRGPLLAITPFSSPLSSPAHKIALGILAGTSILFKPSDYAARTGQALFEIIKSASARNYVYFLAQASEAALQAIVSDERIGIVSFTGGYETGRKIIKAGGVKKYHMELAGGNSPVICAPDYQRYDDQTLEKLLSGILAKNGQRCVSIKHIFIPRGHGDFVIKLCNTFEALKTDIKNDFMAGRRSLLGPLIAADYALKLEERVTRICKTHPKIVSPLVAFERADGYVFPALYAVSNIDKEAIKDMLGYDLPGPVVFVHSYKNSTEYKRILSALQNDYMRSGLQLSFFTDDVAHVREVASDIYWGGIIINDIPTFRDDFMSFGGFGRSGLSKEGFFETLNAYTDPRVQVYDSPEPMVRASKKLI